MPQTTYKRHKIQEFQGRAQETWQEPLHLYDHASLAWLMLGANRLTRAITAAILDTHGLLDEQPVTQTRRRYATTGTQGGVDTCTVEQRQTAVLHAQARTLRREMQILRAQARALCREAETLCKARAAPAAWSQPAGEENSSLSSRECVGRGAYTPSPALQHRS
jgi:hypothetical protein